MDANITAVPEPGTLAILFAGLVILGAMFAFPKARPWGIGLLCVGGGSMLLLFVAVMFSRFYYLAHVESPPAVVMTERSTTDRQGNVTGIGADSAEPAFAVNGPIGSRISVLLFAGLAIGAVLLAFRQSRPFGIAVLCLGGVLAMLGSTMYWLRASRLTMPRQVMVSSEPTFRPVAKPAVLADAPAAATAKRAEAESSEAVAKGTEKKGEKKPDAKRAATKPEPAWVKATPGMVGDAYQMAIVVGPWKTRQECDTELPDELRKALFTYAKTYLGSPLRGDISLPHPDYLRRQLVKEEWEEVRETSVGPMTQLHVLLRFDNNINNLIIASQQRGVVTDRIWTVGTALAAGFWFLGVLYGYLKIDLATGGRYRSRLRIAAVLAILVPVAAALAVVG
jgi:hypothetical protein